MKKRNRKKNLMDLDEYQKEQNNKSKSKAQKKQEKPGKIKKTTSLENLYILYPNISHDLIEEIYEENNNNFSHTKEILKKISESENNENEINNENKMEIEEDEQKDNKKNIKKKNKKNNIDISEKAKFNIISNDDFIDINNDKSDDKEYNNDQEEQNINKDNNNDYNKLMNIKDKNYTEYPSIFDYDNLNNNNDNSICNKYKEEPTIDNYLFDININFLSECFGMEKEDIVNKLCEFKFDINKVVSNILNEKYQNDTKDENDINNQLNDNDIEKILIDFENGENNEIYEEEIMMQKAIENSIKNSDINSNNINDNINYNINYNNIFIEENFLEKKIEDIKDSKIKKDLKQLISDFPLEEEYYIKSAYYSCDKDYEKTHKYLYSNDVTKNLGLKSLLNSKIKHNYNYNSSNKPKKDFNKNKSENQERRYSTLKKILENKAINWKLEDKNINVNDYIALRNRLYKEARNFFAAKNYKTGQSLMNRAKRLTQEIEEIAKDRGLNKFFENNKYNSNNKEIDIHGLHVKESKTIINSKIKILRQKKIEDNLKSIDLTIITGTGSHSERGKPVLYPELLSWLKNKNNIKVNGRLNEGVIFITIY